MVKYVESNVVFEEIPECVTLAVTVSNCPFHCIGCHSDYLRTDCGAELNEGEIDMLMAKNHGCNCFLFLGDGNDTKRLCELAEYVRKAYPSVKTAVYSGYDSILDEYLVCFDYVKTGKYIKKYGPLNNKNTNQRLYKVIGTEITDVTYKFWNRQNAVAESV